MNQSSLAVATLLPDIQLPSAPDGDAVQIREHGGRTTVLVTVHSSHCPGCQQYLDQLASLAGEFDVWDARLLVVVPGPTNSAAIRPPFGKLLADESVRLAKPDCATVSVADRYGEIFHTANAGSSHDLTPARDLPEWLKYLGTLCPE